MRPDNRDIQGRRNLAILAAGNPRFFPSQMQAPVTTPEALARACCPFPFPFPLSGSLPLLVVA
jgi:hypothetical protein